MADMQGAVGIGRRHDNSKGFAFQVIRIEKAGPFPELVDFVFCNFVVV